MSHRLLQIYTSMRSKTKVVFPSSLQYILNLYHKKNCDLDYLWSKISLCKILVRRLIIAYLRFVKNSNRAVNSCLRRDSIFGIVGVTGNDADLSWSDGLCSRKWLMSDSYSGLWLRIALLRFSVMTSTVLCFWRSWRCCWVFMSSFINLFTSSKCKMADWIKQNWIETHYSFLIFLTSHKKEKEQFIYLYSSNSIFRGKHCTKQYLWQNIDLYSR